MADDEYAKVQLEDGSEEGEGHGPRPDGEEVPKHLGDHGLVGHGQLVVAGVPEDLLVGGDHPGQRDQGGRSRESWRDGEEGEGKGDIGGREERGKYTVQWPMYSIQDTLI